MDLTPADLSRIRELYAQGFYRRAYDAAVAIGPIREWTSTPARLIGGRLAIQLGAPSLGRQLHLLAFRSTPAYPEAIYYHARYRMERFGPMATWAFMRKHPDWSDALPELHGDWLALAGFIAARLRDFDRAERWLNRAEVVCPRRPWPCIERSSSYELADRLDDALVAARRSLEIHPWFRPGVQSTAHLLLRLGRDREALDLLTEANAQLESGLVAAQLAALQNDLGQHADARKTLDRYADLSPMMEPETQKWLAARWADTAYFLGERSAAIEHANAVKDDYDAFAARRRVRRRRQKAGDSERVVPQPLTGNVTTLDLTGTPQPTVCDLLAVLKHPLRTRARFARPSMGCRTRPAGRASAGWVAASSHSLSNGRRLIGRGVPFIVTLVEAGFSQPRLRPGPTRSAGRCSSADGWTARSRPGRQPARRFAHWPARLASFRPQPRSSMG